MPIDPLPELTPEERERSARQWMLPEIGLEGQRRLQAASVLVAGVGGLGSASALYLAAAGVGRIGLVDGDVVGLSNLQRQVIHGVEGLGEAKVESARRRLLALNPALRVDVFPAFLSAENAAAIAASYDLLMDGCDNLATRQVLNAVSVAGAKPYIYGAVSAFDGQVSVFDARRGPCYRCLFPTLLPDGAPAVTGVVGPLPGVIGALQALEAFKLLLGIGQPLIGRLLLYDGRAASFESVTLKKNPYCPCCGELAGWGTKG